MGKRERSQSKFQQNRHSLQQSQRTLHRQTSDSEDDDQEENELSMEKQLCGGTTALLLAIYVATLHPSIPGGDSGELIVSAHELGVAHPPGYPIFTITAWLTMFLPIKSPAWRVNFLNAIYSAIAGGLLQLTVYRLTGCVGSSLLAIGLFCLGRLGWIWSVKAEVFGLNNLFIGLLMLLSVQFANAKDRHERKKIAQVGAFVCGLSLCNQHTIVVYVGVLAIWVISSLFRKQALGFKLLVQLSLLFVAGLTPYLYLPLSSFMNIAYWSWGDQTSLSGLLTHLLREEYGTFDLGKDSVGAGFSHGLWSYMDHLESDIGWLVVPLIALGVMSALYRWRTESDSVLLVFVMMLLSYILFFAWRANLDMENPLMKGVVERFWLQSDMVLVVIIASGLSCTLRWLMVLLFGADRISLATVCNTFFAAVVILLQFRNATICSQRDNYVVRDFAKTLLDSMPRNSIVFTKGDLPTNTMRYLHLCEDVRPDLQLLDVEVFSYQWFLPKMKEFYPDIKFPGDQWGLTNGVLPNGKRMFNFKSLIEANYKKDKLFACIGMQDRDPSWQDSYNILPHGVCSKIEKHNTPMAIMQWANSTTSLANNWTYPMDGFSENSWEKVANDEIWHAKISTAFFLYGQGEKSTDPALKPQFLLASYELYFRAIKVNQSPGRMHDKETFPPFWHRNFALVCERLLHVDHKLNMANLCKLAMYHFQQYLLLVPDDRDAATIQSAIDTLRERLDTYLKIEQVDQTVEKVLNKRQKS